MCFKPWLRDYFVALEIVLKWQNAALFCGNGNRSKFIKFVTSVP